MTTVPASRDDSPEVPAPDAPPGLAGPAALPEDTDRDGEVDVLYLAGQRLPAEGAWLLATAVDGQPGGEFTAQVLPETSASAFGGDVVVRLSPDDPAAGQPPPGAQVQVHAVMSGRLIPVATWAGLDLDGWPERVRPAVAFAMGVLTELEEHGADLGARDRVDLNRAAGEATAGLPLHLTFPAGRAAAPPVP